MSPACESANREQQFIIERQYMRNVTPKTILWYQHAFKAFQACTTEQDYKRRVIEMRQRGLSPSSVNSWLRVINAYVHWTVAGAAKCSPQCVHLRVPYLQEEKKIVQAFSPDQVSRLLSIKPRGLNQRRALAFATLLLDTGLRLEEARTLKRSQIDLDNLLITVMGKGRKERKVPLTLEGRKTLYHWMRSLHPGLYVFPTTVGTPITIRNVQRDLKALCARAGITGVRCSPHTLRHTLAVTYLRRGGNLEYLRRILGHSSILVTQRYLQSLTPEDLQQVHNNFSPLSAR